PEAEHVLLPAGVEDARLAFRRNSQDAPLGPSGRVQRMILGIDRQAPDVAFPSLAEDLGCALGIDLDDSAVGPGAGNDRATRPQRHAKHLAVLAAVDGRNLALGRDLVDLTLVTGRDEQVPLLVLDDV